MKKEGIILIFIVIVVSILIILLVKPFAETGSPLKPMESVTYEEKAKYIQEEVHIIDITHNGVTHEYVSTGGNGNHSLVVGGHWEECKYCKEKE